MKNNESVVTAFNASQMPRTKQVALVAVLLAIGAVLRMFTPPIAGITPNFVIAMYCLAILLIRPNIGGALGIGLVGGAVAMYFSKSPIPALNLISEPVGAVVCALLVRYLPELSARDYSFKPLICGALGTFSSGLVYLIINCRFALQLPPDKFIITLQTVLLAVVLPVTAINAVLDQVLYHPAKKFLRL